MRKITFFKMMFAVIIMVIGSGNAWGQATLPVNATFTSTTTASVVMPTGFTQSGVVGYAGALKFDTQTDWLQLYFNASPSTLSFDIGVNNTFPGTITATTTFTVEESIDGSVWTTVSAYTNVPGGNKSLTTLNSASRYIRWYYTTKPSGSNISLKNIILTAVTPACTPSNLAFATPIYNKLVGDASIAQTATSLNTTTAITYSSNASAVAAVDANGVVTIGTAGSAVITATQDAGAGYCATTATYTVNVAASAPTITVTEVSVPAMTANIGSNSTQTINVSGANLTTDIVLALSGANTDQFSIPSNTIVESGGSVPNTIITITYTPTTTGSHAVTLTMTSGTATPVTREISGTATQIIGLGTQENPYSVADVKSLNNSLVPPTKYWVLGYIVGVPSGGDGINLTTVDLTAPFTVNTAIALSDIKDEIDLSKMIGVQLPTGAVRTALNLADNATILNKWVKVYGTLEGYFSGTPGVKNVTDYLLESTTTGTRIIETADAFKITASNGKIQLTAVAGEIVEVFNATGQKLMSKLMIDGLNTIPLSVQGVVFVKVGNRITKVIL